jgi:hypothetical protein
VRCLSAPRIGAVYAATDGMPELSRSFPERSDPPKPVLGYWAASLIYPQSTRRATVDCLGDKCFCFRIVVLEIDGGHHMGCCSLASRHATRARDCHQPTLGVASNHPRGSLGAGRDCCGSQSHRRAHTLTSRLVRERVREDSRRRRVRAWWRGRSERVSTRRCARWERGA